MRGCARGVYRPGTAIRMREAKVALENESLSDIIGAIYDCALDPARWEPTLARIGGVVNARNGTILHHGGAGAAFAYSWGVPEAVQHRYQAQYLAVNPLATLPWHCAVGEPVSLADFMTPTELRATRFYREFLAPLGWFDFVMVPLEKSAAQTTTVSFTRHEDDGPPLAEEIATMRLLAPHVRRAAMFHGLVEGEVRRASNLAAALDAMAVPVLLFDRTGACLEANALARTMLGERGTIRLTTEGIAAVTTPSRVPPILGGLGEQPATPPSFSLTGRDGQLHVAHVMPVNAATRDGLGADRRAACAVFVQPVGALQPLPGEVLVKLYGLTPAETRLIGLLARDMALVEAAGTLGITIATARSHLQHIFDKTGTSRQSQLMRLVLSALPSQPG